MTDRIGFYSRDEKYGWLSNFHRCPMTIGDKVYPTNEHFYQSRKALAEDFREWIRLAPNPYLAMKAGRLLRVGKKGELDPNWDQNKLTVMLIGLFAKFKDQELRNKLLDTGDAYLYEDSASDTYWGLVHGNGINNLGKLLMQVRDQIRKNMSDKQ